MFPEHRLVYLETPKVACTSVKVALCLDLCGASLEDLTDGRWPRPFPEAVVHDRAAYPARSLADLAPAELAEAVTAAGWIRFCVVRDPFSRVFSAWESKVFVGDAGMFEQFQPLGSGDRFSDGELDVRASFCEFVGDLAARRDLYFDDMHFRPQHQVVHEGAVPFTDIVRLEGLAEFVTRLGSHLGRPLVVPRVNEGLGMPWRDNYDEHAISVVGDLYAEDIARFGFERPSVPAASGTRLDPVAVRLLAQLRLRVRQVAAIHQSSVGP